jgi:hypothetical protein
MYWRTIASCWAGVVAPPVGPKTAREVLACEAAMPGIEASFVPAHQCELFTPRIRNSVPFAS